MAYEVNWVTREITIPATDMVQVDGNDYELDADSFWREIRRLEWESTEGLWAPQILEHNDTRVLAGTTYVPENKIINDYTIWMDPAAEKVFLRGDNNNIVDVLGYNGVSVIPSNSAGNTIANIDSVAGEVWDLLTADHMQIGSFGELVQNTNQEVGRVKRLAQAILGLVASRK